MIFVNSGFLSYDYRWLEAAWERNAVMHNRGICLTGILQHFDTAFLERNNSNHNNINKIYSILPTTQQSTQSIITGQQQQSVVQSQFTESCAD